MAQGIKDKETIRRLASQVAEIASLPIQEKKRGMWRMLNAKKPSRPMVTIDEVCWNEMNVNDELTLMCTNEECRRYEDELRKIIYQWKHFPVDMVVEPFIRVPMAIDNTGFGLKIKEDIAVTDPDGSVVGHRYLNQFERDEYLEKIKMPFVVHDSEETCRRLSVAHELFDGLLRPP